MTRRGLDVLALVVLPLVFWGKTDARIVPAWSYSELFKDAELILIVKPLTTRDAVGRDPIAARADYLVSVETKFDVLQVVKGDYSAKTFELMHFRLKAGTRIDDGPILVDFKPDIELRREQWTGRAQPDYVLFLKKGKGGRMEPVSGLYDPGLSVKQMLESYPQ